MLYTRARVRYLAALGLPSLVIPLLSCSGGGTGTASTTPTADPSATPTVAVTAPFPNAAQNATTVDTATDRHATAPAKVSLFSRRPMSQLINAPSKGANMMMRSMQ